MTRGYVLVRTRDRSVLVDVATFDGCLESTWCSRRARPLVIPTRIGALSLAWAIGAGADVRIVPVERWTMEAKKRPTKRMTRTAIRAALRAEYARLLALGACVADVQAVVTDEGGRDAMWRRMGKAAA